MKRMQRRQKLNLCDILRNDKREEEKKYSQLLHINVNSSQLKLFRQDEREQTCRQREEERRKFLNLRKREYLPRKILCESRGEKASVELLSVKFIRFTRTELYLHFPITLFAFIQLISIETIFSLDIKTDQGEPKK